MARLTIPLVGGSYKHDSLPFDAQETINLFVERGGPLSKSRSILRRFPGLKVWATVSAGNGPIRGMYVTSNDRFFVVRDNVLYEFDSSATETNRGTLTTLSGNVTMTDNGTQLVIADGQDIWVLVFATNALAKATDSEGLAPMNTPVTDFADGYVFGFDPSEPLGTWRHSNLNNANTWSVLDVYTAEGSPDALITLKVLNRQLWLFGSKSFEVWYDRGGDNAPTPTWSRIPNTFQNIGCAAKSSVSVIRGLIFWLGASKDGENIVWMSGEGYKPVQISNKAMETTIAGFTTVSDATSYTFEYLGHFFYALTFPTGNKTFVFDITENEWTNWTYRNITTGEQERQRAINHVFFDRKSFAGDYENGNIYELSKTTYTDNGNPIVWERYFPHFEKEDVRISWYSLQIDVLVGSALRAGQGSDPKIQIQWSDDGGYTYSHWHNMTLGKTGKYGTRVIKRLMGASRDRVFHIRSSEPIPISIQDNSTAEIDASES
jgi:hypothetical protein